MLVLTASTNLLVSCLRSPELSDDKWLSVIVYLLILKLFVEGTTFETLF